MKVYPKFQNYKAFLDPVSKMIFIFKTKKQYEEYMKNGFDDLRAMIEESVAIRISTAFELMEKLNREYLGVFFNSAKPDDFQTKAIDDNGDLFEMAVDEFLNSGGAKND